MFLTVILRYYTVDVLTDAFREQRSGNTLYQELSFQDTEGLGEVEDGGEGGDITGSWVHPGEYASSGESGQDGVTSAGVNNHCNRFNFVNMD